MFKTMINIRPGAQALRFSLQTLLAFVLATSLASSFGAPEKPTDTKKEAPTTNGLAESLKQKWGIEIFGPFLSAGGNIIDLRYRVLDPAKAAPLAKHENKPTLVNQATGAKLLIPNTATLGSLRQVTSHLVAGRVYFMLFANTQRHVKAGDKVTLTVGDFKIENLTVE